jgi:hypothetical protein
MVGSTTEPRRSCRIPYVAATILGLLTGYVWGPLTSAPITDGVAAAIIAFALGILVSACGARLRAGAVEVTYAVIVLVVIANAAVFLWGAAHSH